MKVANSVLILFLCLVSSLARASGESSHLMLERNRGFSQDVGRDSEITEKNVSGIAEIVDRDPVDHTKKSHVLKVVMSDSGNVYELIQSPEVTEAHEKVGVRLVARIDGVVTSGGIFNRNKIKVNDFDFVEPSKFKERRRSSDDFRRLEPMMIDKEKKADRP